MGEERRTSAVNRAVAGSIGFAAASAALGDNHVSSTRASTVAENPSPVLGLYTFGAPRVGNSAFRTLFNMLAPCEAFRVVARRDLFTVLPAWPGFCQVGREVWLDSAGEPAFCMSWAMEKLLPGRRRLQDHWIVEYHALLAHKFHRDRGWRFMSLWL